MSRVSIIVAGVCVVLLLIVGLLYTKNTSHSVEVTTPQFEKYPVADVYRGQPAEVDFDSYPGSETFRTAILSGVSEGVNFAGHYTVVTWGCGTSCQNSAIVDVETGNIVVYGIVSTYGVLFQPDSRLLVVNPKINVPEALLGDMKEYPGEHFPLGSVPSVSNYYLLENNELTFAGRYGIVSGKEQVCDAAVSPARNPFTQEIREFPTPCHIPFGWEALEVGEGNQ